MEYDLREVINELVREASFLSLGKKLKVSLPDEPVYLVGQKSLVQRAISNFLNNANEATEAKGANLTVSLQLIKETDGKIILTISDTGPGLSAGQLEQLKRQGFLKTSKPDGHGLGLKNSIQFLRDNGFEINFKLNSPTGLIVEILN